MASTFQRLFGWLIEIFEANPLRRRENDVRRQLASGLREYEALTASIYNAVLEACNFYAANPQISTPSANLQMLLLQRLIADLRVCQDAACTGYALQAMTLAATVHEVAYGLAYIGASDQRAREWSEHTNERKQYPLSGHKSCIQDAGKHIGLDAAQIDQEYRIYQELCWGKHANPVLQREYGALDRGDHAEVQQQPYYSERTLAFGRYGLFHALRSVATALVVFSKLHLDRSATNPLHPAIEAIVK